MESGGGPGMARPEISAPARPNEGSVMIERREKTTRAGPSTTTLTATDLEALAARWIPPELAEEAGLYRVDSIDGAQLVGRNGSGNFAGLAIPYFLPGQEQHPREYRLRRDRPDLDPDGKELGKYLGPPGRSNLAYFPPGITLESLTDTSQPVVVVEGEFKALSLWRLAHHDAITADNRGDHLHGEHHRWLPVGLQGCWSWRGTIGKARGPDGDQRPVKGVIPDFDRIEFGGRRVYLVPDTDIAKNGSVAAAWRELGKELEGRGANVVTVEIPPEPGINGIDDFLGDHGPEKALKLFAEAKPRSKARDFHLTDLGNARRLVARHGDDIWYVPAWNSWAMWDGCRWKKDDMLEVENRAKETVQSLYGEAAKLADEEERKKAAKFALASESAYKIRAMLQLARSEVPARSEDFDQDHDLLNFTNGTLHLPSGELRPHRREDQLTKVIPNNYVPDATCPSWLAFLQEIMGVEKDPDRAHRLIDYLQKALGYSVTGRTVEKAVFVCHGSGDNGKTTLLNTIRSCVPEYSTVLQIDSLMTRKWQSSNAQADLADLQGSRFAMTSETDEGHRLSEGRLKRITQGMGTIRAVRKYENPITFPETHKLWMDCNHKPLVKDDGRAIWNRLHLIPFQVSIPKDKQDKNLTEKLLKEATGILAWLTEGARLWYTEELQKPPEVEAATRAWREESDELELFLSECCVRQPNTTVSKDALYRTYREWCEKTGVEAQTKIILGKKLTDRDFDDSSDGKTRSWLKLGLISDRSDR